MVLEEKIEELNAEIDELIEELQHRGDVVERAAKELALGVPAIVLETCTAPYVPLKYRR